MARMFKKPKGDNARSSFVRLGGGRPAAAVGKISSKTRGRRFILIVGDEGAILVFMQGSKVLRRLFAPSVQAVHTEAIREIMRVNSDVPIYLLADVLDQQYVPHSFPPVSAMSVGGLVKRRLDRDFQADDLKGALPLGRDKSGRREWRYLLVALAKTALIGDWIDLLVEQRNDIGGIYLVPVEGGNYLAMLNNRLSQEKPLPWQLLISHNKVSGFRQVVMRDGKLVFTRVSQAMDDAVPEVVAGNIEQEILNTVEYLKRLEFQNNADLAATIIIAQDVGELIDMKRFGFGGGRILSPLAVAEALGLEQAALSADRFGDVVMAAAFGIARKHTLRFSTAYIDKLYNLYKAATAIRAAAALLSIVLIIFSLHTIIGMVDDYSAMREVKNKIGNLQPDLNKAQASVDGIGVNIAFKSAVVATAEVYSKDVPQVLDFVRGLSAFVAPEHRLQSLVWLYSPSADGAATLPAGGKEMPLTIMAEFDFSGAGISVSALNKAAESLIDRLKAAFPQYEVTTTPFAWLKEEPKQEEITLDTAKAFTVSSQNMFATITFKGVKPLAAAAVGAK